MCVCVSAREEWRTSDSERREREREGTLKWGCCRISFPTNARRRMRRQTELEISYNMRASLHPQHPTNWTRKKEHSHSLREKLLCRMRAHTHTQSAPRQMEKIELDSLESKFYAAPPRLPLTLARARSIWRCRNERIDYVAAACRLLHKNVLCLNNMSDWIMKMRLRLIY